MINKTLQVLIKARARISSPKKWGKGIRGVRENLRPLSTCCAAEAIEDTAMAADRGPAFRAIYKAAGIGKRFFTLVEWNDAPSRTHAQVLATFDKAIKAERAKVAS